MKSDILNNFLYVVILLLPVFGSTIYFIYVIIFGILLSIILKNLIKEKRPKISDQYDYGMPSTHSQTYALLITLMAKNGNIIISELLIIMWILTGINKIRTGDHTVKQYLTGGLIGTTIGLMLPKS